jgi:hypothetical protein
MNIDPITSSIIEDINNNGNNGNNIKTSKSEMNTNNEIITDPITLSIFAEINGENKKKKKRDWLTSPDENPSTANQHGPLL